jgi:hypothetical protein
MAATLTDKRFADPAWTFERKLDGIRVLAYKNGKDVTLWSRNRLPLSGNYPAVVEAIAALKAKNLVLDSDRQLQQHLQQHGSQQRCGEGVDEYLARVLDEQIQHHQVDQDGREVTDKLALPVRESLSRARHECFAGHCNAPASIGRHLATSRRLDATAKDAGRLSRFRTPTCGQLRLRATQGHRWALAEGSHRFWWVWLPVLACSWVHGSRIAWGCALRAGDCRYRQSAW